jgi:NAD-dependent dihydropyrimidine dehydrogenase PreA subunit
MPTPVISTAKCNGCGTCKEICPMDVFIKEHQLMKVQNPSECIGCRACEAHCGLAAIIVEE